MIIKQKVYWAGHPSTAGALNNIGIVNDEQGNYYEALDNYSKALIIQLKRYGESHPSTAGTLNNIGIVKQKQGN